MTTLVLDFNPGLSGQSPTSLEQARPWLYDLEAAGRLRFVPGGAAVAWDEVGLRDAAARTRMYLLRHPGAAAAWQLVALIPYARPTDEAPGGALVEKLARLRRWYLAPLRAQGLEPVRRWVLALDESVRRPSDGCPPSEAARRCWDLDRRGWVDGSNREGLFCKADLDRVGTAAGEARAMIAAIVDTKRRENGSDENGSNETVHLSGVVLDRVLEKAQGDSRAEAKEALRKALREEVALQAYVHEEHIVRVPLTSEEARQPEQRQHRVAALLDALATSEELQRTFDEDQQKQGVARPYVLEVDGKPAHVTLERLEAYQARLDRAHDRLGAYEHELEQGAVPTYQKHASCGKAAALNVEPMRIGWLRSAREALSGWEQWTVDTQEDVEEYERTERAAVAECLRQQRTAPAVREVELDPRNGHTLNEERARRRQTHDEAFAALREAPFPLGPPTKLATETMASKHQAGSEAGSVIDVEEVVAPVEPLLRARLRERPTAWRVGATVAVGLSVLIAPALLLLGQRATEADLVATLVTAVVGFAAALLAVVLVHRRAKAVADAAQRVVQRRADDLRYRFDQQRAYADRVGEAVVARLNVEAADGAFDRRRSQRRKVDYHQRHLRLHQEKANAWLAVEPAQGTDGEREGFAVSARPDPAPTTFVDRAVLHGRVYRPDGEAPRELTIHVGGAHKDGGAAAGFGELRLQRDEVLFIPDPSTDLQ